MATYYKPQSPIQSGEDFIYPITTADQIMKSDKSRRLEQAGLIVADNSTSLGGVAAKDYALKTDTAPDSAKLGGKAPEYYTNPRNLLDNSDFRNPVNQRGKTSYTANGYTIDRWELWNGAVYVTDLGYISTTGQLYQKIDIPTDKTYTFAIKTGDGIAVAAGIPEIGASMTLGNATIALTTINGYVEVVIQPASEDAAGAVWAALYEGSYTAETLPPYVPKGKHVEMLNCGVSLTPHNLLDNSDFRNPVNQRGFVSGNAVEPYNYFIDRWLNGEASSIVPNMSSNGIKPNGAFCQRLDSLASYIGRNMTFAVGLSSGDIVTASGTLTDVSSSDITIFNTTDGQNEITVGSDGGLWYAWIDYPSSTIQWAALYEGSYTAETLPPYVPKGYAAELAECQRYYYKIPNNTAFYGFVGSSNNTAYVYFDLLRAMRTTPSYTSTRMFYIYSSDGSIETETIKALTTYSRQVEVSLSVTGITAGIALTGYIDGSIFLSADL